jgi:hypothetical protein
MRALSVRQPYADQIMRGTKRIEYRSRPTKVRGRGCQVNCVTGIHAGTLSPNTMTNWLRAALQSRIGIVHFLATRLMAK